MARQLYELTDKIYRFFDKKPILKTYSKIITLVILIVVGLYLRALPALNYGLELHANDPWIEYWQANYTYTHGPASWYSLTKENPITHIFWYPWGRDFTSSSYPGTPIWTAITYYLVSFTELTIKEWIILQPLIFATIAMIAIYLAANEISRGNTFASLLSVLIYAVVPAASDRNIIGFVEKEGIALGFIFLFIYFYSKLTNSLKNKANETILLKYTVLSALTMAAIGWFWGGFIYVFGSFVLFLLIYPLVGAKEINKEFMKHSLLIIVLSLLFVALSPAIIKNMGLYPFRLSIGAMLLGLLIFPVLFYLLYTEHRKLGLHKPLLTPLRYFMILVLVAIAGVVLISLGIVQIGPRYAWALGLHFVEAPPLVQSVEEHQPALEASGAIGVLVTWGTGLTWLFFASPLIMAILGAFYLLYKGEPDRVYTAVAFLVAFYAYMNATYFEATAAAYGLLVAGVFVGYLASKIIPSKEEVMHWRSGRVRVSSKAEFRTIAGILLVLVLINLGFSAAYTYDTHSRMIPSIMAGYAPLGTRNDAWYRLIDFINENLSKDSVIITWWDYGYPITVNTHRATVADGATLNGTQISILAKILTAKNSTEAINLMKKLRVPFNKTYIMTFDVFRFVKQENNTYVVVPIVTRIGSIVGMVDIPKSIWMIRIGGRDPGNYLYLYVAGQNNVFISPRFDDPENLPLIYKLLVDGILYLNALDKNHTYYFAWYTGSVTELSYQYNIVKERLGIKYEVTVTSTRTILPIERPLADDPYIKPYMVIARPFEGYSSGDTSLVEVIVLYQVVMPGK
ncbi:MAG: peptide permease [Staphylothermus sp.]|nr:peptide permease [Staphylothermus sp.]